MPEGGSDGLLLQGSDDTVAGLIIENFAGNGIEVEGAGNTLGGSVGAGNILGGNGSDGIRIDSGVSGNQVLGNYIGFNASLTADANANGVNVFGSNNIIGGTAYYDRNVISGNTDDGVLLDSTGAGNQVLGNDIGVNYSGLGAQANSIGIEVAGNNNTVGGSASGSYNIISGNTTDGVKIDSGGSGNQVVGNNIGVNIYGTAAVGNSIGIEVAGSSNTLGTSYGVAVNVISGNTGDGVKLDSGSSGNQVLGNYIGTNPSGTAAMANKVGVEDGGSSNIIGGSILGDKNVISGNSGDGVLIDGSASGETMQDNYIGLNVDGNTLLSNGGNGVEFKGVNNTNGGNSGLNYFTRNFISGNSNDGVLIDSGASGNQVQGNFIGVGVLGTNGVGNLTNGIEIAGSCNTIGGNPTGVGNVISGSGYDGILLDSTAASNLVQGNYVGTDYTGEVAVANSGNGIEVAGKSNTIGGTASGARNIISGNYGNGVQIDGTSNGNLVLGNCIGLNAVGAALGNDANGITIAGNNNSIGGSLAADGNSIANNNGDGVLVLGGSGNSISSNSIFANSVQGIVLTSGSNNNVAAPSLSSATLSGTTLAVTGTFTAPTANVSYVLQFFANPSGDGEGRIYLGSLTVTPTSTGTQNFTFSTTTTVTGTDPLLTATLTDPSGDASEFSTALNSSVVQTAPSQPVITVVSPDVGPVTGGATVTLTGSGFTGTTAVSFGNGYPAGFLVVSDTTLKVTTPAEAAGTVHILVTNAIGQSTPTTADQYTYTAQPSITAVSPNQGSTDGGNTVTITGFNLNNATSVLFGAKPATSFTDKNGQITAVAPAQAAGVVDVQVDTANGTVTANYTYTVPAPVITGVGPASGSTDGFQEVTITGTDLSNATQVSFGGTPAAGFNVISATEIQAKAPPGSAGTVNITVTTAGGTSADSTADQFSYTVPAPAITSVNPGKGSIDGGSPVTITGTDLSGATQVLFGTTAATSFRVVSPSEIIATVPAGPAGSVDITVTTASGTSATSTADQYTYTTPDPVITGLSPSSGSTAGGEQVLITGTDLGDATAVMFGTAAATSFHQVSSTQIAAIAPAGSAGTVDVYVTTAGSHQSANNLADQFQYVAPTSISAPGQPQTNLPTVTGITSSGEASGGGTTLVITGTNFTGTTQVSFDWTNWTNPSTKTSTTQPATSFAVNSATQITAVAPAVPSGNAGMRVSVTVQTQAGSSAPSTAASYAVAPDGSGSGGIIVTTPPLPSDGSVSNPTLYEPFAPHFSSSPLLSLDDRGDGSEGTPTTATSISSTNKTSNAFTNFHSNHGSGSGGGGGGASGQYTHRDTWSSTFNVTVKLGGQVIYTYTAKSGGDFTSYSIFGNANPSWTTTETSWSNDSWSEAPVVTSASSGTKGNNYTTTTTTYNASGSDQSRSYYQVHGKDGVDGTTEGGNSSYFGSSTSNRSTASHGNGSHTITGGNSTGQWTNSAKVTYNYTNNRQGTLGSDGIWVSTGSMSNGGNGTSYSSLSSKFGYTLTNSSSTGAGSTPVSGQYSGTEKGSWKYDENEELGTAGWHYTGGKQTSSSVGASSSTTQTKGNSHSTTANGKSNSTWSHTYSGKGGNSYSGGATLGSDGIWIRSGATMSTTGSGKGHGTGNDNASFDTHSASGSSSITGAGTSKSSSTSGSTTSATAASTMPSGNSRMWTPVSGKESYSDNGKSKDSMNDGGKEKSVLTGDALTGPWSDSSSTTSNFTFTQKSVMGAGGQWTTTATESGGGSGKDSANESGTESLKNSTGQGVGSLTIKESDSGKSSGSYHAEQTMTKGGGWVSVSGSAKSTNGSTSKSTDTGGGTSSSATADGDSNDNWSVKGNETDSFSSQVNAKLGSDDVWITSGSLTISGSGSGKDSNDDKGKYEVTGDDGSSSSSGSGVSDGSSGGWETGSATFTSGSGSTSSNTLSVKYSLGSDSTWNLVSGSAVATITASAKDSINGKGDFGFALQGGSDSGTWNIGGSDNASNTIKVNSTLGSNGSWTSTGTDTGSGGGSWSSGDQGGGGFVIDTGSVSSGNWNDETGTVSESGSDNGGYNNSYNLTLGTSGSWQGSSGSASANDTETDDFSEDETDNYGVDIDGEEVTGTNIEDDSDDSTATANDSWALGTNLVWTPASSSSSVTETVNDTVNDNFSGGSGLAGSDQGSLQETLSSSNGGTPVVTALTETASGSFSSGGPQATFSVNVSGSPSAPTDSISQTNTTYLNGLSVDTDDIDTLDSAIVSAIATDGESSSDGVDPLVTSTDNEGDTTAWTFNSAGQLTSRTLAYGTSQAATTTFAYDAKGNLISVTDPDGNVTTYTYNAQGEETSMTDPLGNTQTMEYNAQGQLIEQTNRDGMYETYVYNTAGQMVQETWYAANGTETDQLNFDYSAGQLVSASNDEGTYTFSYNAQGQLIGVTEPFGVSLTFAYDSNGNRTEVQDSFGGTTQSTYDANNQLVSELFSESGQSTLGIDESYNADGTVANVTYYNGSNVVATTNYGYDNHGDVTSIVQTNSSGTVLGDYTYSYDTNYATSGTNLPGLTLPSNTPSGTAAILAAFLEPPQPASSVLSETDNGTTTNYGYDGSGQLVSEGSTTQSYDLNGNPNGSGYVVGKDNQLLSDGTYNYTYDADGNEATKTNIATGDKWTYAYNNADQLISAVETSASNTVETQVVIQYDVFGNRLEEQVWTQSAGWTTTRYAYDAWDPATPSGVGNENWKVLATLDGNNNLVTRYINGDKLDQVFAQISTGGSVAWYLTDRLGSTVALVDNNDDVLDAITYDAWGNITSQTNPSWQPSVLFAGVMFDPALGLYFNGNGDGREYDPETGGFIQQDPMQFRAGDSNLYRYVGNDPTNAIDPSGLDVIYLVDPKGAKNHGHAAVLVGNDIDGWDYYSFGEDVGSSSGRKGKRVPDGPVGAGLLKKGNLRMGHFPTLNAAQASGDLQRFQHYIRYDTTQILDKIVREEMEKDATARYWLVFRNCTLTVGRALRKAGLKFDNEVEPNKAFNKNKGNGDTHGDWPPRHLGKVNV